MYIHLYIACCFVIPPKAVANAGSTALSSLIYIGIRDEMRDTSRYPDYAVCGCANLADRRERATELERFYVRARDYYYTAADAKPAENRGTILLYCVSIFIALRHFPTEKRARERGLWV